MLRQMGWATFQLWMAVRGLEPFGDDRADWQAAAVATVIANANRDKKKKPSPYRVKDFLLKFKSFGPKRVPWQEQKAKFFDILKDHAEVLKVARERKAALRAKAQTRSTPRRPQKKQQQTAGRRQKQ